MAIINRVTHAPYNRLGTRPCCSSKTSKKPGATAFVPALVNSGFPSDRFSFEGFLPVKKGRTKRLKELSISKKTMVFYESPHRVLKTLKDFGVYFSMANKISVSRELTKIYEETFRGTIEEALIHFEKNNLARDAVCTRYCQYISVNLRVKNWLGRQDSNLRMPTPKTGALPLGDAPITINFWVFYLVLLYFSTITNFFNSTGNIT